MWKIKAFLQLDGDEDDKHEKLLYGTIWMDPLLIKNRHRILKIQAQLSMYNY